MTGTRRAGDHPVRRDAAACATLSQSVSAILPEFEQTLSRLEAEVCLRLRPAAGAETPTGNSRHEIAALRAHSHALPDDGGRADVERQLIELRIEHLARLDAGNWQGALETAHRALALRRDLPALHAGAACALARLERAPEALLHLNARVELLHAAGGESGAVPERVGLAQALTDRGVCRYDAGQVRESDDDFARALDLLRVGEAGTADASSEAEAALAHNCRGISRAAMGDYAAAIKDFNAAIERRRGPAQSGNTGALRSLATSLNCRANAWSALTSLTRAQADYDEAVALHERLAEFGEPGAALELACVLVNRGMTRRAQARPEAACEDYDRAIALYRARVAEEADREHRADLAWCLTHRSYALHERKKWDAAAEDLHEAIELYSGLPGEELTAAGLQRVLAELDALRRGKTDAGAG